jgi:signal transduction histidine kinase
LWLDYLLAISFVVANVFDAFVSSLRSFYWGWVPVATGFYVVLSIFAIVNFAGSLALLIYDYATARDPHTRKQVGLWLMGMVVALPLGLSNMLPVYGIHFPPLGNLGAAAWEAIVAYAIVRHRLMNIDVFVARSLAYIGVIVVVVLPAVALSYELQHYLFHTVNVEFTFALGILFLCVAIFFPMALLGTEDWLRRSLFRQSHEVRIALDSFARRIVKILDRDRLAAELATDLHRILDAESVSVYLLRETDSSVTLSHHVGEVLANLKFPPEDEFTRWLFRCAKSVFADDRDIAPSAAAAFKMHKWEVCTPLVSGQRLLGFIAFGRRKGLLSFASADVEHLNEIADQASIALENARRYDELRSSRALIDRASRLSSIGILAAGIAHEIRNPLVSIHTFFQMAPSRLGDEEFMTSFLGLAGEEVQRISHLIDDLLAFARSPSTTITEVDLSDVVERTLSLLAPQARQNGVEVRMIQNGEVAPVLADADQILQVIINLVLNAIQATPHNGSVSVEISSGSVDAPDFSTVDVIDTGAGIPEDIKEAIFDPFFTTKERGTGLGLAIAHRIVAELGGTLTLESTEGSGTRFTISLPSCPRNSGVAAAAF